MWTNYTFILWVATRPVKDNQRKEVTMFNILKDLAVLLFSAGEELEKKAKEYREERENRHREFEEQMNERKEEFCQRGQDELRAAKEKMGDFPGRLGLATKEEINEVKGLIKELSAKIDNLGK